MAENPWAWRDGVNPYRSTPFQVLDLEPDVTDPVAVRAQVHKRRRRLERAPDRYRLFGQALSVADVNRAEELLADPESRVRALLLTHSPEPGPTAPPDDLLDCYASLPVPPDPVPPVTLAPDALLLLLPPLPADHPEPLWPEGLGPDIEPPGTSR